MTILDGIIGITVRLGLESVSDIIGIRTQVVLASGMRYGWFVYANEELEEGTPADLDAVFRLARQRGCEYVLFDCGAIPLEDLPILHPDFTDAAATA